MSFKIATNIQSLVAQRVLNQNREAQGRSIEKMASGERIVHAADDAAGMAISEKLRAQVRSLRQAHRNANDGVSLVQTAEGGLNEIQNILIRLRELSMQAASDTVGDTERSFSDKEVKQLVTEANRISAVTNFNGKSLLNGTGEKLEFQVGIENHPVNDRMIFDTRESNATVEHLGIGGMTVSTKADAQGNLEKIDKAIITLSDNRSGLGALQNRLQASMNNLQVSDENISAAYSRIRDTDMAAESAEMAKRSILTQSGVAVLAQANVSGTLALKLLRDF